MISLVKKQHARDFCLPQIEIWCRGESTDLKGWTDKMQPCNSYIIFEKTADMVNCYMDDQGIEWIKTELRRLVEEDKDFISNVLEKYYGIYGKIKNVWENEAVLDYEGLVSFMKIYHEGWSTYEGVYFLGEILPQDHKDFNLIQEALIFTDKSGDKSDKVMRNSLKKCFPELGELSSFLLMDEIYTKKIPSLSELEKRAKNYFYTNNKLYVDKTKEEMQELLKLRFEDNANLAVQHFRGRVAYAGKARGNVRRIINCKNAIPLIKGEIIVTSMTTPDFLPLIKEASAIITDEGGITCHAAIISREFKIPCIIGTRIATSLLKDNDLIDVDAVAGKITLIRRQYTNI